jgi:hypothetical protein
MTNPSFALVSFFAAAVTAGAANVLAPGDFIRGGQVVGGEFQVGVVGTAAGVNNWPAAEPPEDVINGIIGGGGEKYLNFAELNTGIVVTPAFGPSIVTSIEFWVANDAEERDPASYELWGTNAPVGAAGPYNLGDFSLISGGALALPLPRDTVPDALGSSQVVTFANASAYSSYMLVFPTVKNEATANSMQISEVQFDGVVPEPGSILLLIGAAGVGLLRRRR